MKKIAILFICSIITFACVKSGPRRISNSTMQKIIEDVYLTDAAVSEYNRSFYLLLDTIEFYSPIIESYGYKMEDFTYTINKLSQKKSNTLSLILDNAADNIDKKFSYIESLVKSKEKWEEMASKEFIDTLYTDYSVHKITSNKVIDSLKVYLPAKCGTYTISLRYSNDESNFTRRYYTGYKVTDYGGKKVRDGNLSFRRSGNTMERLTLSAEIIPDLKADSIEFTPVNYHKDDSKKFYDVKIDSIVITYKYPTDIAVRKLKNKLLNITPLTEKYAVKDTISQDSSALRSGRRLLPYIPPCNND